MKKIYIMLMAGVVSTGLFTSCKKVLDKRDLSHATADQIFGDSTLVKENLDYVYNTNRPTWYGNTGGSVSGSLNGLTEEAFSDNKFVQGTLTNNDVTDIGSSNTSGNYNRIRITNTFIRDVTAGTLPQATKNRFIAQALFWRAYRYFDLVRLYGGVPLVLVPLDGVGVDAKTAALLPRNSTSQCMAQIIADLDTAIKYLPKKWPNAADYGKVTQQSAAAFKGRILLTYASPQFNPTNDQTRWQKAYDANLAALTICNAAGSKLMPDYGSLWYTEGYANTEALWVTPFNTTTGDQDKDNNSNDNGTRPANTGTGTPGVGNQPTWDMVQSYPMLDGLPAGTSAKYPYVQQNFYKNRDPRFDKTIAYNGATWPLNGNTAYRNWTYLVGTKSVEPVTSGATTTGFFLRKGVDPNLSVSNAQYSGVDWIELRYAELLLNLAECAAELNRLAIGQEAYTGLIALRQRAGIEAGASGLYGLQANMTHDQMITAIMYERKIELAYEGKRYWDLRRRNLLQATLNGIKRTGLKITTTASAPASLTTAPYNGRDALTTDQAYAFFTLTVVQLDTKYSLNIQPGDSFFGIPTATISSDPNILQNNTWGGTFDPLQ